jgi:hypothetical protein
MRKCPPIFLLLLALLLAACGGKFPSDAEIEIQLRSNEKDYRTLLELFTLNPIQYVAQQSSGLKIIGSGNVSEDKRKTISNLVEKLDIKAMEKDDAHPGVIKFVLKSVSPKSGERSKGIAYVVGKGTDPLAGKIKTNLDELENVRGIYFRNLKGNWFIYYESD